MKKILLVLLLSVSLTTNAFPQSNLLKVRIDRFDGGQNTYDLPNSLNANQGTICTNVITNRRGKLSKRKGQALFATDFSNMAPSGIGSFMPDSSTSYMVVASGPTVIYTTSASASWLTANLSNALTTGHDTEFLQADNLLAVLNGQDYTAFWNGTTWDPGSSSTASPPTGTTAAWLLNYFFVAGNPTNPDWIYYSNNLDPQTFTDTDIIKVNSGDGQKIVRLEPFREFELIVYKERSIYNVDLTDITSISVKPITTAIGCVAPRTVVNIGNDHWFLSSVPFGIRSLVRSSFDKILIDMVSQPVQDYFDGTGDTVINKTHIDKACAVLYDDKYIIAIPTGISTVNNTVLVYDFITKNWSVIDGWFPEKWLVWENNLYYIDALDGRVIQCFTGTQGDMSSGPTVTSSSEPLQPITYTYATKDIDFDNPENYKQLDSIELEFEPVGNYTATVYINLDDGGWQEVGDIDMSSGAPTLPVALPFTLTASGIVLEMLQLQQYGEFRKIRVKIEQSGTDELCILHSITIFAQLKNWRRE